MKKLIFLLILLLAIPMAIFAQDVSPTDWGDIIMNPGKWFVSLGTVALLTAFLATFVNGLLKITKNFPKQLIAWLVAIVLVVGSDILNFGYAKDLPILIAVLNGLGAGLVSNGVFDIPVIKAILDAIGNLFPPKK